MCSKFLLVNEYLSRMVLDFDSLLTTFLIKVGAIKASVSLAANSMQ